MEYTELADYPLPAGTLTEWIPGVDGEESWTPDARGVSFTHEDHCSRGNDGSWIGTVFEIHRPYDAEAVRATLLAYMARHEAFRTRVARDATTGEWHRSTAPATSVRVVEGRELRSRSETQVFEHLEAWFAETVSPTHWPHFVAATVVPEPHVAASAPQQDKFLLVFAADHSVMDAYSQIYAINEIDRLYAHALDGTDPRLPDVGSYVDFSAAERKLGESLTTDHAAVLAWKRFLDADGGRFPSFPLPLAAENDGASTDLAQRQSSMSSWLLNAAQVDTFNGVCRAAGHNMQSGILAALALVSTQLSGSGTFRTVMPMHTRSAEQWAASVGWYVGILPMQIHLDNARTFTEALERAAVAGSEHKGLAAIPYSRVASMLDSSEIPRFVVSYIDLRFLPDAAEWQARRGRALRSECHAENEVYFWVNRTLQGLNISARFPSSDIAATNVHRFIAEFVSVMTSVIEEPLETLDSLVDAVGAGRE